MPREHNQIQSPELLARIAKLLGLRQHHVVPTVNEGLQCVVVVEDLSKSERASGYNRGTVQQLALTASVATLATNEQVIGFQNNSTTKRWRVRELRVNTLVSIGRAKIGWFNQAAAGLAFGNLSVTIMNRGDSTAVPPPPTTPVSAEYRLVTSQPAPGVYVTSGDVADEGLFANAPLILREPGIVIGPGTAFGVSTLANVNTSRLSFTLLIDEESGG